MQASTNVKLYLKYQSLIQSQKVDGQKVDVLDVLEVSL